MTAMNTIILITCFIGVYISPVESLSFRHRQRHGKTLVPDIKEPDLSVKESSQGKDEDIGIFDGKLDQQNIEPKRHISDTDGLPLEDTIPELELFPIKYLMNLEKEKDHGGPETLSTDRIHDEGKQIHKAPHENHDSEANNEDHGVVSSTKVKMEILNDLIKDNQQSASNDDQSEETVSSGEISEELQTTPMKSNFQRDDLDENDKKEYIDILGQHYNDNDFKYILNITFDEDDKGKELKRETEVEIVSKELNEESLVPTFTFNPMENKIFDRDDSDDSDNRERNDTIVEMDQKEIPQVDMEYSSIEENDKTEEVKRQGLPVSGTRKNEEKDHSENKPNYIDVTLPSQTSIENQTIFLNNNDIQDEHKDHVFNSTQNKTEDHVSEKHLPDPCRAFQCKRGRSCEINEEGNPSCVCQEPSACHHGNVNDHICGTDNKTYDSPCHLFGTKCKLEGTKEGNNLHLDYQGPCKYILPCSDYELAVFPFRMRDWLKNVLIQLYERDLEKTGFLSEKQREKVKKIYENEKRLLEGDHSIDLLLRDFEKNYHMYVYPVHWQFNQLDRHTVDRMLTRSELAPLRAPLVPMEHCVTAFFQACNTNSDKHISLSEWGHCFGIKEEDIDEGLLF